MIAKITKMVPTTFYIIDGVEFLANDVFLTLETITEGNPEDLNYDLYDCAEKLANLGYLNKKWSYHEEIVYYDTEDKKAEALFNEILKM